MKLNPQTIMAPDGSELVVLTKAEYDFLANRLEEDDEDVAIFDERMAELQAGKASVLPPEVSQMMLRGDLLLRALRRWRGLTQFDMVGLTQLSQGYLSDLEAGKKQGTAETLGKIAFALKVEPAWLVA